MSIFIARQPIFDAAMNVFGYELLFRSGMVNSYTAMDADYASSNVMINSFCLLGLDKLTGSKKAFINFTGNLLKQDVATLFPREELVIEILENVNPEKDIVENCRKLKKSGYSIALDDFILRDDYLTLIELADIIKVDFLSSSQDDKKSIVQRFKGRNIKFLAEKVETPEEFQQAKEWGYTYFQGYFFSKPAILSTNDIPPLKMIYLQLIEKINSHEVDFSELAEIVIRDVALSYKLLKLVNSSAFGLRSKVESVRQALVVLGTNEIKKLVSLLILQDLGDDKPEEIVHTSLVRAKFAELLAAETVIKTRKEECFLMGMFSTLDVLMSRPMEEVLSGVSLSKDVRSALLKKDGLFGYIYQLILAYEMGDWSQCNSCASILGINPNKLMEAYVEALGWPKAIE